MILLEAFTSTNLVPELYFGCYSQSGNYQEYPARVYPVGPSSNSLSYNNPPCYCYSTQIYMRYARYQLIGSDIQQNFDNKCDLNYTGSNIINDGIYSFKITFTVVALIPARPPIITSSALASVTILGGTTSQTCTFTAIDDPYQNYPVSAAFVAPLPSFITLSGWTFTIAPPNDEPSNIYTVQYMAFNSCTYSAPQSFTVTVTFNDPPVIDVGISDFSISVGSILNKTIVASDPQGTAVSLTLSTSLPSYISHPTQFQFDFSPQYTELSQTKTVTYTISDGIKTSGPFSFLVTVVNLIPALNTGISDFSMYVGSTITKSLVVSDPEGATVTSDLQVTLPSYITKSGHSFTFTPTYTQGNSTFTVKFKLSDGPQTTGAFQFIITVVNRMPVATSEIADFSIKVGSGAVQKSFSGYDPDGNSLTLTVTSTLPSYITLTGFTFTINPSFAIAATVVPVTYTISDGVNTLPQFQFIVTVINDPPKWTENLLDQECEVGLICTYSPGHLDPEGNVVTMTFSGPSYITKTTGNIFRIAPPYSVPQSIVTVTNIILSDGVYQTSAQAFIVQIINSYPYSQTQFDQIMKAGTERYYDVPPSQDLDNNIIVTTVTNLDPAYATFDPLAMVISFRPSHIQPPDNRTIYIHYFDGAYTTTDQFQFILINEKPYFKPNLIHQNLVATFALTYTLPIPTDPEGNFTSFQFLNVLGLPRYATWIENARAIQLAPLEGDEYNNFTCVFNISDGLYTQQFLLNIIISPVPITQDPVQINNTMALQNLGPPYFLQNEMPSLVLKANQLLTYELPMIVDPDGDSIELPEIQLGASIPFATMVDLTQILFNPKNQDEGRYQIKVILRDLNSYFPLSNQLYISVKVIANKTSSPTSQVPSDEDDFDPSLSYKNQDSSQKLRNRWYLKFRLLSHSSQLLSPQTGTATTPL
ncbi:hypothetical protein FGO68_gene9017 [Halteria grandinella]|uniref:Cadherin domain-containing protein n=1 Tax=Halteria grandinella TaxID=5974 RepID=A0A8J8P6J5_HALGN|nr:hypothetical protein FGO68_gene9017 [Halteria grandinella]